MGNKTKTIEDRFATSVKNQVSFFHGSTGRGCTNAWLHFHGRSVPIEGKDLSALKSYLDLSFDDVLKSRHPLIRALGMLDARLGKRKLASMNVKHEDKIVRTLFAIRCSCEGLPVVHSGQVMKTELRANYESRSEVMPRKPSPEEVLAKRKRETDARAILAEPERNKNQIASLLAAQISAGLNKAKHRKNYLDAVNFLLEKSKLVNEDYMYGVNEILLDWVSWVRPLSEWKPRSHNADKQFSSLLRHLFAEYPVPIFMDNAWLQRNSVHQRWFKYIGAGYNIRYAHGLPIKMTKKMAHHFLTAPAHYSVEQGLRWGQLRSLGADRQLTDAIVQTRLSDTFVDEEFWMSVFRFFVDNPMLDTVCVGPIIDYIWNQKYENVIVFVERGVMENRGPAQPNFCMKGRTAQSLLAQVEAWHDGLGKQKGGCLEWAKSKIADFHFVEGTKENKNMKVWRIAELLTSKELISEGRQHRHCVATYAQSCYHGQCSIWSMTVETEDGVKKLLTIEVRNKEMVIRQVRGKLNRLAESKEREVIQRWATQEKLLLP